MIKTSLSREQNYAIALFCLYLFLLYYLTPIPPALLIGLFISIVDLFPFIGVSLFYLPFADYFFYSDQWLLTVIRGERMFSDPTLLCLYQLLERNKKTQLFKKSRAIT